MPESGHWLRHGVESGEECAQKGLDAQGERDGAESVERGRVRSVCKAGVDAEPEREEVGREGIKEMR